MFSSSSSPQSSSFQSPLLLWPPLLFLLSKPHAQLDMPLLPLPIKPEAIAPSHAFAVFLAAVTIDASREQHGHG